MDPEYLQHEAGVLETSTIRSMQIVLLCIINIFVFNNCLFAGFMLFSFWAWNIICAPDIFSWNFSFMLLNMGQLVYIIYQRRPVKFDPELEEAYQTLFHPFKVE
jgi:hypothetical protein